MNRNSVINNITENFKDDIISIFDKSPKRIYIDIKAGSVKRLSRYIFKDLGARFNIASATDARNDIEILYHFTIEDINLLVSLRVMLPKDKNIEIESLTSLFEAANWIEREMHELLGINFIGHPDLRRLLLPEDWPDGVYPLRQDYKEWDKDAIRDRGV